MTQAQENYKKQLIQKIQINKSNVFFDDTERKEFILSRFGVDSTTKLSIDELKLLLDFCTRKVSDIPMIEMITSAQEDKIIKLWSSKARDKSFSALSLFINRITHRYIKVLQELTKKEATKIIVALEKMA